MTIEPATDADLAYFEKRLTIGFTTIKDDPEAFADVVSSLIARIRAEQAEKATARADAIRECIALLEGDQFKASALYYIQHLEALLPKERL